MNERRITIRFNMDKFFHHLAYDIYLSIPSSQRSDYIRLAIILMHDRDEQAKRMREMLAQGRKLPEKDVLDTLLGDTPPDMSEAAKNMLSFISQLNTQ
jgi:hypothetical protein